MKTSRNEGDPEKLLECLAISYQRWITEAARELTRAAERSIAAN